MKPEESLWKDLRKAMGPLWDATRHEDKLNLGIPDVSYGYQGVNGWIELKTIDHWPGSGGVVKLNHPLTAFQMQWLRMRQKFAGNCWILVKVMGPEIEYGLFPGCSAFKLYEGLTEQEMRSFAIWSSPEFFPKIVRRHLGESQWLEEE